MRTPVLDLNLLQTLLAVADTGTVTGAAERLAYTQSTVSMQLHRLESTLGVTLHEKSGRGICFTNEGERLLGYARRLLTLNNETLNDLRDRRVSGSLSLGIPEDYAFLLTAALAYFHQMYPAMQLQVTCGASIDLVRQVQASELDLAVVTRQTHSPGGEVIRRDPLVWAVGAHQQPSLVDPLPLALYSPGADVFREVAEHALSAAGRHWRLAYSSQSMTGLMPIVVAGLAVVLITRDMLNPQLRALDEKSGLPALPSVEIALHRAPGRPSEPARQLAELIRQHMRSEKP
ncbi:LysR substrate-binding domain-containing protein [Salicola sp. Rm-C-2C1-2]|uniref:LysR substrate-binding domain-containing protein n=1 Tax=Salicola sp. Rm-C-2C1-2 TaxID=3141321 RepID=UPI0032E50AE5